MKLLLFLVTVFTIHIFSQTDWVKWGKADYSYQVENQSRNRDYSFASTGIGDLISKTFLNTYWFFISDVDGDNCPFRPSCSSFFAQSIKETNIFQGTLMFFDRFTRDMNIFKGHNHYPRAKSGRYYDPPSLYTLNSDKIDFKPASEVVSGK
jgi:putative component of membrane protein insertase Oxa1/YidC/SpoIIIJ protein YidD